MTDEKLQRRVLDFDDETGLPVGAGFAEPPEYPMTTLEPPGTPIDKDAQTEVDSFIDEMGGDESKAKVIIYKMHDDSGQMAYCKRMPVASFRRAGGSEWAVSKWGPGEYQFRILLEGHRGIYRKWDMILIGDPDDARKNAPANMPQQSDTLQGLQALAQSMQSGFTALLDAMQQNRPKERSMRELLEEMALMKQVIGGDGGGPNALMDVFLRGMEMAKEANSDKESNTNDLLINLAHELMPILNKAIDSDKGAPAVRPQLPNMPTTPNPAQPTQKAPPQNDEEKMNLFFRAVISKLVKAAQKGGAPEIYANVLLDDIPSQHYETLLEFLNKPDWFTAICALNENAKHFAPWFDELKAEVVQSLSDDDGDLTPDDEPGKNPAGDTETGSEGQITGDAAKPSVTGNDSGR